MRARSLAVLMWMHLMVRKRRYILTLLEHISPMLWIVLLFSFRNYLKPPLLKSLREYNSDNMVKMTEVKLLDIAHKVQSPSFLLYTPDTKLTNALMDEVGLKLGLTRLTVLPDKNIDVNYKGYYAYSIESEIADFLSNIYKNEAIIIFKDLTGDDWPDKLEYTIRMQHRFKTNSYKSQDDVPRDHKEFGDDYDQFMLLQWAVDTSYIKARTGHTVPQTISLQEFPNYGSVRVESVKLLCNIMPTVHCWSSFIIFVFLVSRLVEERASGIQELIKMGGVSSNTLGLSHFLNVVPAGLVYVVFITVFSKVGDNPLMENTSGLIIFTVTAVHFVTVAAMAFAASYLVKTTQYVNTIAVFANLLLWLPMDVLSNFPTSERTIVFLTGVLPHVPIGWFWNEMSAFEQLNFGKSHSSRSGPMLLGFAILLLHCAIFFFLSWYLSHVRQGQYGQVLPWNFLCQKQYWTKKDTKNVLEIDEEESSKQTRNEKYFEDPPKDMIVGIRVENVSKWFPKHRALTNVSLHVYKGEITILLGHNGAGKTTLMSIITGIMSATEGKIYLNGMDSTKQREKIRNQMGLCPQHHWFFSDLTVLEHVMFFTLLKEGSYKEARASSLALLKRLGIAEKAKSNSSDLSGGMKRRLQLACALTGGASVLVLDEPTSGLDVETRRQLWDLLLSLRGDRTVLLTTHFMEEADALGDRVAALYQGQLRCHATTMFLKKAIGTGYRLSFTTNDVPRETQITSVVTSFVPDASVKEKTINSLSYNLPATGSAQFPKLFTALEEKKSELGIETIGVGVSTLEEVFLKLCSDTDTILTDDDVDTGRIEPTYNKATGLRLYKRQFLVLFKRQCKYVRSKTISFIILQALLPIAMIFAFTSICNNPKSDDSFSEPDITLDLDLYTPLSERKVLYNVDAPGASLRTVDDSNVVFITAKNITHAILRTGKQSILEFSKHLVGIQLNDTDAKALYTTVYRHAAPVAVNLLSNVIASQYLPATSGRVITTHNHPLDGAVTSFDDPIVNAKSRIMCILWAIFNVFIILSTNINFSSLPVSERVSGSRHLHMMAGCPATLYWLCTLSFHMLVCVSLLVVASAVAAATLDTDSTFGQPTMILTLMVILTLGCLAFFAFMYLVSFYFAERATGGFLIAIMFVFGFVTTALTAAFSFVSDTNKYLSIFLALVSYTMPPHAMTMGAAKCAYVARLNALCTLNRDRCPDLLSSEKVFNTEKCCAGENPQSYFEISNVTPMIEMISLIAQFIVYMTLVVLTQKGMFSSLQDKMCNGKIRKRTSVPAVDEFVRAEADFVTKEIALPTKQIEDANVAMLVNDVHKNYYKLLSHSCYAVQGLSISIKKGECFGLLGVNGAGKSTMFKMITAEECITKGQIYANGHHINKNKGAYLHSLGYCPQFFGLDSFQSGSDNLALLLTLRGFNCSDVSAQVTYWMEIVGLQKYSARVVSSYSGGCTRRLGAAAALASGAPLTLLDEPTAGVDVAARRRVWSALRRALNSRRSIVITSHSMEEMEALCARIGIMSGGRLRALGTPADLRARHATGHAVIIKLKHISREPTVDGSEEQSELDNLKSSLHAKFNCTLKDEHKTMLHYHINETMHYSDLFSELEKLKITYPTLVEDYSVTETTLEEVFLSFAKYQQQPPLVNINGPKPQMKKRNA